MLAAAVVVIYTTFFLLSQGQTTPSPEHNTFCVTGSIISPFVDGTYEYDSNTNANDSIYYNQQLNFYLFPWITSAHSKQYLIGSDPTRYAAHSFSTIRAPSPYTFIAEDFIKNWQSWTNNALINDTSMRLVNCNDVYVRSAVYKWINYSVSIESSIYHNSANGLYLYRSNIGSHNEKWQIYDGTTYETLSHINMTSHIRTNTSVTTEIFNETAEVPTDINITTDIIITSYTNTIDANTTEISNINQYEVTTTHDTKNDLLIVIIATSSGLLIMLVSMVVIVKKYLCGHKENDATQSDHGLQTNSKPETNSKLSISNAQSKCMQELQIKIRSPSSATGRGTLTIDVSSADARKKKSLSVYSADDEVWPANRRKSSVQSMGRSRSSSKYADILPPCKPPPIGMRPVLTAKQQAIRPLPPTPTEDKVLAEVTTSGLAATGETEFDDVLNLADLI